MFHLDDLAPLLRLEGTVLFVRLLAVAFSRIYPFPRRVYATGAIDDRDWPTFCGDLVHIAQ
jgi:hypothetical protein